MKIPFMAALLPALLTGAALAESGSVIRNTELRQKPFSDAAVVATVSSGTQVEILSRQGAWMNVSSNGQAGWVKMLSVRVGNGSSADAGSVIGQGVKVATTGSSGKTVTTGVKGLSEEELSHSQPDYGELERMKGFSTTPADAGKQANLARLTAVQVPEIAVSGSSGSSGNGSQNPSSNPQMRR
ncbi:SH3 domain-containing protein [Chitinilyticum aquatile]|uniref:SH3 domain-containing protein n=1 Tax=Chitinilyticum aquatile TaxID=362520 RepID=UPI000417ACE5|nr:SH3 domain-containing protein [Chitinilyticum aquatile]